MSRRNIVYPYIDPNSIINTVGRGKVRLREKDNNGENYVSFKAPESISNDMIWTLPSSDGNSGQVLQTNGGGILSWTDSGGGLDARVTTLETDTAAMSAAVDLRLQYIYGQNIKYGSNVAIAAVDLSQVGLGAWNAANLRDGNTGTVGFTTNGVAQDSYVLLDFGLNDEESAIQFGLYVPGNTDTIWQTEHSDDGATWTPIGGTFTTGGSGAAWYDSPVFTATNSRWWRLRVTNTPAGGGNHTEIRMIRPYSNINITSLGATDIGWITWGRNSQSSHDVFTWDGCTFQVPADGWYRIQGGLRGRGQDEP